MNAAGIAGLAQGLYPAVRGVVNEVLARRVGDTMPTNASFKSEYGIGAGTLQRAINLLQERGAVRLTSRGHLGRTIVAIDVGQCWQAAGLDAVRLLLPPGGATEFDLLEAQLSEALTKLGIPHTVTHQRGGARRLVDVVAGAHDLTAVSWGVVDAALADGAAELGPMRRLDRGTYYADGQMVAVTRVSQVGRPKTVAIDRDSPDHVALTLAEFPQDRGFEYVAAPFPEVPAWVARGRVDVGIWHRTATVVPLDLAGLRESRLQQEAARATEQRLSGAVLAAAPQRPELAAVLPALELDALAAAQRTALAAAARTAV